VTFLRSIFLIIIVLAFLSGEISAYQVDAEHVPSDKYFEITLNEINNAQKSIHVYMYIIAIYPNQPNSKSHQLVDALIEAKERGIGIQVVLDQNIDFLDSHSGSDWLSEGKSRIAYEYLKSNGIPVYFDDAHQYTHNKVIIIDEEITILGSTNWTKTSLTRNNETNILIRSKEFANEVIVELAKIERQKPVFENIRNIPLSWEFLNNENLMGQMVTRGDERAFDIYLYLLKKYDGNDGTKVIVDYDELAEVLGIDNMTREAYRRQIAKVLKKLQNKYALIAVKAEFNKNAEVILKDYKDSSKPYSMPAMRFLQVPETYWNYGWSKKLSFSGKVMYLLNQSYSPISSTTPSWSVSQQALSERHHISVWFIGDGVRELRKFNLIEVHYEELGEITSGPKHIAVYTSNPLYDPRKLNEEFKKLEELYGKDQVVQARAYAKVVYEEYDYNAVVKLIELERKHGREILKKAVAKVSRMKADNPKKTMGYLINTIESMAK